MHHCAQTGNFDREATADNHRNKCSALGAAISDAPGPMLRSSPIPQVLDITEEYSESLHGPPGNASAQSQAVRENSQSGEPPGSRECGLTSIDTHAPALQTEGFLHAKYLAHQIDTHSQVCTRNDFLRSKIFAHKCDCSQLGPSR